MGKMHELLAVEGNLVGLFTKVIKEAAVTFSKKPDHFLEHHKQLQMFDSAREFEQAAAEEHKAMVTTVDDKLDYVWKHVTNYIDLLYQKEMTNREASADLVIDGVQIESDVPATFLLTIEQKMTKFRELCEFIPTLAPGSVWELDKGAGKGIYKAQSPEVNRKTEKTVGHKVLYDATPEHPAQLSEWTVDVHVGDFTTRRWSGMLSPAEKSELLSRIDKVIMSAKRARMKANTVDSINVNIGEKLANFIFEKKV